MAPCFFVYLCNPPPLGEVVPAPWRAEEGLLVVTLFLVGNLVGLEVEILG